MVYCIKTRGNGHAGKRGARILSVLMTFLLAAGMICELPALEFTESDAAQQMICKRNTGRELLPHAGPLPESTTFDVSAFVTTGIPSHTDIKNLVDRNRKTQADTVSPDNRNTDFMSDIISNGIEIPNIGGFSGPSIPEVSNTAIRIPDIPVGNFTPPVIPDIPSYNEKPEAPDTPIVPDKPIVPDIPVVPDVPSVDDTPVVPPVDTVPDNPDVEEPGEDTDPGGNTEEEDPANDQPVGFTVNEDGMICGFDPTSGVVQEYRLTLPSEGCIGIARGAFEGAGAGINEIHIPPNIVNIEPGVLSELAELEWIELTGPNENYTVVEGMLFDSSMTTLLAFPCAKIGTHTLPTNVERLEDYSFLNTRLTKLDMVKCGPIEAGSCVFGENGGNGLTIQAPREYLEHYQNIFEGQGVTVQ